MLADYNHNQHIENGERLFENLLLPERPGEVTLGKVALALREHLWDGAFALERAHSLSQRLGDCPAVQAGTNRYASMLRSMAIGHNMLWTLRNNEEEFRLWLSAHARPE